MKANSGSCNSDKLQTSAGQKFIVTESIFSMDGDRAPIPGLVALAERYGAELIIDDVRRRGRGERVEIRFVVDADQASLDAVDRRLAPLRRRGMLIVCRRSRRPRGAALKPDAAA